MNNIHHVFETSTCKHIRPLKSPTRGLPIPQIEDMATVVAFKHNLNQATHELFPFPHNMHAIFINTLDPHMQTLRTHYIFYKKKLDPPYFFVSNVNSIKQQLNKHKQQSSVITLMPIILMGAERRLRLTLHNPKTQIAPHQLKLS